MKKHLIIISLLAVWFASAGTLQAQCLFTATVTKVGTNHYLYGVYTEQDWCVLEYDIAKKMAVGYSSRSAIYDICERARQQLLSLNNSCVSVICTPCMCVSSGQSDPSNSGNNVNITATNQGNTFYSTNPGEVIQDAMYQKEYQNSTLFGENNVAENTLETGWDTDYDREIVKILPYGKHQTEIRVNWKRNTEIDPDATPRIFERPSLDDVSIKTLPILSVDENIMNIRALQSQILSLQTEKDKLQEILNELKNKKPLLEEEKEEIEYCKKKINEINEQITVYEKRLEGREEWLKKVDKMSPESLEAQEKNYHLLADMASLAECSYWEHGGIPDGYDNLTNSAEFSSIMSVNYTNEDYFHCELFRGQNGKYVLSFRGTDDIITDILYSGIEGNFSNADEQTQLAIAVTDKLLKEGKINKEDLIVVGHSLGGRLAAEAAITCTLKAYTFNSADISRATRASMGENTNIINTVSANDVLTASTFGLGSLKGGVNAGTVRNLEATQDGLKDRIRIEKSDYVAGYTNVIKEAYGINPLRGHDMSLLRKSIELRYQDIVNKQNEQIK
ncbi:MAG: DUF2974 domain-containing protein [Prevotella sp.]|jgi:hypothetical protein|nr:DUF2974 domain-containing protein [Prevotella sp.]